MTRERDPNNDDTLKVARDEVKILELLEERELSAQELAEAIGCSLSRVYSLLGPYRKDGMVQVVGKIHKYSLVK